MVETLSLRILEMQPETLFEEVLDLIAGKDLIKSIETYVRLFHVPRDNGAGAGGLGESL